MIKIYIEISIIILVTFYILGHVIAAFNKDRVNYPFTPREDKTYTFYVGMIVWGIFSLIFLIIHANPYN